jgi:subtilisin family serine protease
LRIQGHFARLCALAIIALAFPVASNAAKVEPRVQAAVEAGNPIWVFLKDKGLSSGQRELATEGWISPRAVARIAQRGGAYDPRRDQPIDDGYRRALTSSGLVIRAESRWFNAVAGVLPAGRLNDVAALSIIDSVCPVAIYRRPAEKPHADIRPTFPPGMTKPGGLDYGNSRSQIEAIEVDVLHDGGLDGRGVRIGFLDTGYSLGIDAFSSLQVIATRDFINADTDVGDGDTVQMDHGTATLSVCAGFAPGQLIGVAPRAEYALAKTEIEGVEIRIEEDYWVAGLEWIDSIGCDIVSSSLGYINWYTPADLDGHTALSTRAAGLAAQRGLLVVNAAGNEGTRGLIAPADGDSVLAVGASDMLGYPTGFSSRGPTADGRIKPDIVAPGEGVWSARPENRGFAGRSGTSLATPLVSGVCALLLQELPTLRPAQVIDLLHRTASQSTHPDNDAGWGRVRAAHAAAMPSVYHAPEIETWPNPAEDSVRIVTPDTVAEQLSSFEVFTAAGQPVYSGKFRGNSGVWPGLNESGQPVASGIYLVWVRTPKREEIVKVALVRSR